MGPQHSCEISPASSAAETADGKVCSVCATLYQQRRSARQQCTYTRNVRLGPLRIRMEPFLLRHPGPLALACGSCSSVPAACLVPGSGVLQLELDTQRTRT